MMPGQYTAPYRSLRLETLILLIFTIILSSGSFARAEGVEETIKKVLVNNPQITGAEADFNAARDDLGVARAGYLPSVDLDIRYGRENTDIRQLSANGGGTQNLWRREAGITVSEMLWDGNSTSGEVARRGALLNSAEHSLADTQNALAFQTVQAYFDVMRNRELVELSSTILQSHEKILSSVRDKQDSGAGNKVDVEQVLARIALTQSTLLARQGSLRESIARFQRIVGDAPGPLVRPAIKFSGLTENGVVNSVKLNLATSQAQQLALSEHPAVLKSVAAVDAAEAAITVARAGYYPKLTLEGTVRRDNNVAGVPGNRDSAALMLVGKWNLYKGGAEGKQVSSTAQQKIAAVNRLNQTKRLIAENVAIAMQSRATSESRLLFLKQHVKESSSTLEAYRAQFGLNRRTLLDVLNSEDELFDARAGLINGIYDDIVNSYFISASKGGLAKQTEILGNKKP